MNNLYLSRLQYILKQFLNRPLWVFLACLVLVFFNVVFDGTLLRMWNLFNSRKALENRIADIQNKNTEVEERLKKLSQADFLEKEVRQRFNLVGEEEIVFIFSEEKKNPKPAETLEGPGS